MSLTELRPAIHLLPHPEKLLLVQELTAELEQLQALTHAGIVLEHAYEVQIPTENFEAAEVLQKLLQEKKGEAS